MGDHYLGAGNYYLNTAQLICIGPEETPQLLHRDALLEPALPKTPCVVGSMSLARRGPAIQVSQLDAQNRGLQGVEA